MSRGDEGLEWPRTHGVGGGGWCWTRTVFSSLSAPPQPETTGACRDLPQPRAAVRQCTPHGNGRLCWVVASRTQTPPRPETKPAFSTPTSGALLSRPIHAGAPGVLVKRCVPGNESARSLSGTGKHVLTLLEGKACSTGSDGTPWLARVEAPRGRAGFSPRAVRRSEKVTPA